jgi:hypothetical protein
MIPVSFLRIKVGVTRRLAATQLHILPVWRVPFTADKTSPPQWLSLNASHTIACSTCAPRPGPRPHKCWRLSTPRQSQERPTMALLWPTMSSLGARTFS